MFESISSKIEKALHTLRGKGSITDINVAETVKEVRKALLDADVSYPVAKEFTDKVKAEAMGRNVIQSIEPGQLMVKIVHEKLTELMGSQAVEINIKGQPAVVLIAGLQGSGKTTFSAKLANYLKTKKGKKLRIEAVDEAFSFSALPYSAQYIASKTHDYELQEEGRTFLSIDCAVMGLGNSSCGPGVLKKYTIDKNKKHQLKIRIL